MKVNTLKLTALLNGLVYTAKNIDNPVLLYLHGGPGSATSDFDYAFTREWADIYTVVTWDQRYCGKSYQDSENPLTYETFMQDGRELTSYLLHYLQKEKITLLGHSWGSYYGANLAIAYPELYTAFIGAGQLVSMYENEVAFKDIAKQWVGTDSDGLQLYNQLTPENLSANHFSAKNQLMQKYEYDINANERDYNLFFTKVFNPYYSLSDWTQKSQSSQTLYMDFILSQEFLKFDLKAKTQYAIPYFNINGDMDYQANYQLAQQYFEQISAPKKNMFIMKNTTHGLMETKSKAFSIILHQIHQELFV